MGLLGPSNVGRLKAKKDYGGLVKALSGEKDETVRAAAAEALGELADPCAVEALDDARRWDRCEGVRVQAVSAMGRVNDARATGCLVAALDDDSRVAEVAAEALEGRADSCCIALLIESLGRGQRVREVVLNLLVEIGEPAVEPLIDAVCRHPRTWWEGEEPLPSHHVVWGWEEQQKRADVEREAEWSALVALGRIGGARATQWLVSQLHVSSQIPIVEGLVEIGEPVVEPILAAVGNDPGPGVAYGAAEVLTRLGWEPAATDAWYWTHVGAYAKAAAVGAPAVAALLEAARFTPAAREALAAIGEPAVEPLIAALPNSAAADALGEIGDPRAVEGLVAGLWEDALEERRAAATALAMIGSPAVAPLVAALEPHVSGPSPSGAAGGVTGVRRDALYLLLAQEEAVAVSMTASSEAFFQCPEEVRSAYVELLRVGYGRGAVANVLDELGWEPDRGEAGAWYWAVRGDYDKAGALGAVAVEPLLAVGDDLDHEDAAHERRVEEERASGAFDPAVRRAVVARLRSERDALSAVLRELVGRCDEALTAAQRDRLEAWSAQQRGSEV